MSKELTFTVFCLESYKNHRHLSGRETYELFARYQVFAYLRDFYDVLHTTGCQYINHDLDLYLSARGCPVDS